jgi:YfiH family protein
VHLYPFSLIFSEAPAVFFPFMFDKKPIPDVSCCVSTRKAGDMGVSKEEARWNFLKNIGVDKKPYACRQTHSQNVAVVNDDAPLIFDNTDGLVTLRREGVMLSVTVADCLPVFLFDTESGAFGLVHSGWKGSGIVLNALRLMGACPEAVAAVLGPCICGRCYHVDEERQRFFEEKFGGEDGEYPLGAVVSGDCFDLKSTNARLLAKVGVKNLAYCEDCTFTDERLGSFRREGKNFTRMFAGVGSSFIKNAEALFPALLKTKSFGLSY